MTRRCSLVQSAGRVTSSTASSGCCVSPSLVPPLGVSSLLDVAHRRSGGSEQSTSDCQRTAPPLAAHITHIQTDTQWGTATQPDRWATAVRVNRSGQGESGQPSTSCEAKRSGARWSWIGRCHSLLCWLLCCCDLLQFAALVLEQLYGSLHSLACFPLVHRLLSIQPTRS